MADACETSVEKAALLGELRAVLDRLIRLTSQGSIAELELLGEQAGALVEQIAALGSLDMPEFDRQRRELLALYNTLCAELTARRIETADQLGWIRKGRRTLKAYRASI